MGLNDCTFSSCDISASPYGYRPSLAGNACFLAAVSLCLLRCIINVLTTWRKLGFSFLVFTTCVLKLVAYTQLIMSYQNPWDITYYITAQVFSTIAPVFLTLGIHIANADLIDVLGEEHSIIGTSFYKRLTISLNVVAFFTQGLGLALSFADATPEKGLGSLAASGRYAVAAGVVLQSAVLAVGLINLAVVLVRAALASKQYGYTTYHKENGYVPLSSRQKIFAAVLPLAGASVLARCVYRVVFFLGGYDGGVAKDQLLGSIMEGLLVIEALVALTAFHPASWLDRSEEREKRASADPEKRLSREDVEQNLDEVSRLILKTNAMMASSDASSDVSDRSSLMSNSAHNSPHPSPRPSQIGVALG